MAIIDIIGSEIGCLGYARTMFDITPYLETTHVVCTLLNKRDGRPQFVITGERSVIEWPSCAMRASKR
jgi:hypothetical protein